MVSPVRCSQASRTAPSARHRPILGDQLGALLALRLVSCALQPCGSAAQHHLAFAGTVSLRPERLRIIVHDVADSLTAHRSPPDHSASHAPWNEQPLTQAAEGRGVCRQQLFDVSSSLLNASCLARTVINSLLQSEVDLDLSISIFLTLTRE
jgi:hypothetical protein